MRCGARACRVPAWRCTRICHDRHVCRGWGATAIFHCVIRSPLALQALEDADLRSTLRSRTYYESLDLYLLLWEEARLLNPDMGADWLDDVQCDIEIARTLNARP